MQHTQPLGNYSGRDSTQRNFSDFAGGYAFPVGPHAQYSPQRYPPPPPPRLTIGPPAPQPLPSERAPRKPFAAAPKHYGKKEGKGRAPKSVSPLAGGGSRGQGGSSQGRGTGGRLSSLEKSVVKFKTELCRTFKESGSCPYGDKCLFAHTQDELRRVQRHKGYKTRKCEFFHKQGSCPYGIRCYFQHLPFDKPEIDMQELELETPGSVLRRRLPFFENLTASVLAMTEREAADRPLLSFLEEAEQEEEMAEEQAHHQQHQHQHHRQAHSPTGIGRNI